MIYIKHIKCSNDSSRLWWNWQFYGKKRSENWSRPIPSIGLGRQTTTLIPPDLWSRLTDGVRELSYLHLYRTVCIVVDLTAAFDTVNHNVLLSKIVRSTLSEATCRWLSNYIRGRQSVTSCRGLKSKAMIVHTGKARICHQRYLVLI